MTEQRFPLARTLLLSLRFSLLAPGPKSAPPAPRPFNMATLLVAAMICGQFVYADAERRFQPIGIAATAGLVAAICLVVAVRSLPATRANVIAIILGILAFGVPIWVALATLSDTYGPQIEAIVGDYAGEKVNVGIAAIMGLWLLFAIGRTLAWVEGREARRRRWRTLRIAVSIPLCFALFPTVWAFDYTTRDPFQYTAWDLWPKQQVATPVETPHSRLRDHLAELELAQATLLADELRDITPRSSDTTNLFALGIAGDMMGDEFPRELNSGLKILGNRFPTAGHTVKLINNLAFTDQYPVASRQNFATAVAGIASRMDRDADILILFMTSHGSQAGLYLDMGNMAWGSLSPETVKAVLDMSGIKNRVIIVSACHSGVFVPALRDEHTAIIAAAAADRTSFGCASENNWTYFGDALFNTGFGLHDNFVEAFYEARRSVTAREIREGITASMPQIEIGDALTSQFPALFPADKIEAPISSRPKEAMSDR